MEMSNWQSKRGIQDPNFIHHYQQSCSSDSIFPYPTYNPSPLELRATQTCSDRSAKQLKSIGSWNSCIMQQVSSAGGFSSPKMLSFGDPSSPIHRKSYGTSDGVKPKEAVISPANKNYVSERSLSRCAYTDLSYATTAGLGNRSAIPPRTRPPSYSQDLVIAERKRREKLAERFLALSAVIPGLKKMSKASILENSIRYVKELQERVKTLEGQTAKKPMESAVFVKKFLFPSDNDSSSTGVTSTNSSIDPLPEIEARVSDKTVQIRIHCENRKGVLVKALAEIEKLNLSVVSSSMIPFGTSTVEITIVAEMHGAFNIAETDLLRVSLHQEF